MVSAISLVKSRSTFPAKDVFVVSSMLFLFAPVSNVDLCAGCLVRPKFGRLYFHVWRCYVCAAVEWIHVWWQLHIFLAHPEVSCSLGKVAVGSSGFHLWSDNRLLITLLLTESVHSSFLLCRHSHLFMAQYVCALSFVWTQSWRGLCLSCMLISSIAILLLCRLHLLRSWSWVFSLKL